MQRACSVPNRLLRRLIVFPVAFLAFVVLRSSVGAVDPTPVVSRERPTAEHRESLVVERFWSILVRSPRRGTAFDRVYGDYVDAGYADGLLERCRLLVASHPDGADGAKARLLLGLVLERQGDDAAASEAFREATESDPNNALAPLYLGESLLAQGRLREAAAALDESLRRKPSRTDLQAVLQASGRVAERLGDVEHASAIWSRLEQAYPDDPDLTVQIAETLQAEGRYAEAAGRYRRVLENDRLDADGRVRSTLALADLLIREGDGTAALDLFAGLLDRLAPESWLAESVLDRIEALFTRRADETGLVEFYRRRSAEHPGDRETIRRRAQALRRIGRVDDAIDLLRQAIDRAPADIPLRLALIDLWVAENRIGAALEQYREVDRLSPNHPDFLIRWGELVLRDPDRDESAKKAAAAIWKRLLEADPRNPGAAVLVADLMVRNGMPDDAENMYRLAVDLRPDDATYREYLGMFYHRRRQKEQAVAMFRSISDGRRRSVGTLMQSGTILQALGYADDAFERFRDAVALAPADRAARWKFAESLFRRDEIDAGLEQLAVLEGLTESDEQFDAQLREEVRLLRDGQKLDRVAAELEGRSDSPSERAERVRRFWRLAVYQAAQGRYRVAADTMQRALRSAEAPSARLRQVAAERFEEAGEASKAIELYQDLTRIDGVWRIESLRRLASLQLQVDRTDDALETGRRLMELGSGNAENVRFYAELLLRAGRREEAISALRFALRNDPGNQAALVLLEDNLAESSRTEDAIEIARRRFEQTESLFDKTEIVKRLAGYYSKIGRIDVLIADLQNRRRRRETCFESGLCLSEVFASVGDFDSAREVLESLSATPAENDEAAAMLLDRLVHVAEQQNDFPAAVRFQEILCERTKRSVDFDRLFVLYDLNGDGKKIVDLFLRRTLLKASLEEQLHDIDRMIRRGEYEAVDRVLSFLEIHDAPNWEIPFRRIVLASYLDPAAVAELVRDFREASFPPKPTAPARTRRRPEPDIRSDSPEKDGRIFDWFETVPDDFLESLRLQESYYPVLFRDRRENGESPASRFPVPPPRVPTLRDARFLALCWAVRDALDRDFDPETEIDRDRSRPVTPASDARLTQFREIVDEIRSALPTDSPDRETRLERLRFECFLLYLADPERAESFPPKDRMQREIDRDACERTIRRIVRSLGFDGETDSGDTISGS